MSISLCVLGSGSSGNCTLVMLRDGAEERLMLIDAGLSPRATRGWLAELGVGVDRISAIVLTHLDSDHFRPTWLNVAARHGMTIHLHESHADHGPRELRRYGQLSAFNGAIQLGGGARLRSIRLPHDDAGTAGFVIEHSGRRVGYATDLGHVPARLLNSFCDLHALAIESNYDHDLELSSARPWFLKQRIMGDHGHLSNDQSLEAVLRIDKASALEHVVLLHLSRECNRPRIVQRLYAQQAPHLMGRLTISAQHRPTAMLHVGDASRMHGESLFDSAPANVR